MTTGVQFDFNPGIDVTGLSSVTQAQLQQMVAQMVGVDNIGGVLVGSGAASSHPDVTNNPRFIKYIWLDTQTANSVLLKVYQGTYPSDLYADWSTVAIADNSITAVKLANYAVSVLNGTGANKIALKQDGTADSTKALYLLRIDSAGQFVEVVSAASVVGGLTLQTNKLDVSTATNGMVLQYSSSLGYATWQAISISGLITAGSLPYDRLAVSSNNYWLFRFGATGIAEAVRNNDLLAPNGLFEIRSIPLNRLDVTGATASDAIRFSGTDWVKTTPFYGTVGVLPGTDTSISIAHNLGAIPRVLIGYLKNNTGGALNGYAANDVAGLDIMNTRTGAGAGSVTALAISADAINITIATNFGSGVGYVIRPKGGGALADIAAAGNWQCLAYASL